MDKRILKDVHLWRLSTFFPRFQTQLQFGCRGKQSHCLQAKRHAFLSLLLCFKEEIDVISCKGGDTNGGRGSNGSERGGSAGGSSGNSGNGEGGDGAGDKAPGSFVSLVSCLRCNTVSSLLYEKANGLFAFRVLTVEEIRVAGGSRSFPDHFS